MSSPNTPATINLPAPSRVGQATAVEQSRAVAEVHAAMVMAQQVPRNLDRAVAEMERSCRQMEMASRAFYSFPRAGGTVNGPSIHLARELARCWGNIQHGLHEMRRDDEGHQSEMQAFAWDIQTNTRIAHTFIVPHKRDARGSAQVLTDMRDIYENNANNGSRRVREAIFAVLPPWFVERAKELCNETIAAGRQGETLPQRIDEAIKAFAGGGITQDQLERKQGKPATAWTAHDVAQLEVLFKSLRRGEVTRDEAFPASEQPVTVAEIATPTPPAPQQPEAQDAPAAEQPQVPAQAAHPDRLREMNILFTDTGITTHTGKGSTAANDAARFAWIAEHLGVTVTSTKDLTADQADQAITRLTAAKVEAAQRRTETERHIGELFDGLTPALSGAERLHDLGRLFGREIGAPRDLTNVEVDDLAELLTDCQGQTAAWDVAVTAAEAARRQVV
ncbi:hypothetical protein ACIBQX_18950 [Nonomuraea sp. NPDC049714]|uniref:hypothetical protein n=1 Tax=Nonomuraea sp. NPDC049714 TaxID=3364357 RepID=UPI00379EB733